MDNINQANTIDIPNATASLVMGILSISMCYCWGPVGLVLAIIGLSFGNKAVSLYATSPGLYSEVSYKNANAGKVCSIIGLILNALTLTSLIFTWSSTFRMMRSIMEGDFYNFM